MDFVLNSNLRDLIGSFINSKTSETAFLFCKFPERSRIPPRDIFYSFYGEDPLPCVSRPTFLDLRLEFHYVCKRGSVSELQLFLKNQGALLTNSWINLAPDIKEAAKLGHCNVIDFLLHRPPSLFPGTRFRQEAEQIIALYYLAKNGHSQSFFSLFHETKIRFKSDIQSFFLAATQAGNLGILHFLYSLQHEIRHKSGLYKIAAQKGHVHLLEFFDTLFRFKQKWKSPCYWDKQIGKDKTLTHPEKKCGCGKISRTHIQTFHIATHQGKLNVLDYLEKRFPFLKECGYFIKESTCLCDIKGAEHFHCGHVIAEQSFYRLLRNQLFKDAQYIFHKYKIQYKEYEIKALLQYFGYRICLLEGFLFLADCFPHLVDLQLLLQTERSLLEKNKLEDLALFKKKFPVLQNSLQDEQDKTKESVIDKHLQRINIRRPDLAAEWKDYLLCAMKNGFLLHESEIFIYDFWTDLLLYAIQKNHLPVIKRILKQTMDIPPIPFLFREATRVGSLSILKFLYHKGEIRKDCFHGKDNPLCTLAEMGQVDVFEYLYKNRLINESCKKMDSLFKSAAANGNVYFIKVMLQMAQPTEKCILDILRQALHKKTEQMEIVFLLLEQCNHSLQRMTRKKFRCVTKEIVHSRRLEQRELTLYIKSKQNVFFY